MERDSMAPADTTPTPLLSARQVVKRFGEFTALRGIDFELHEGEVVSIVGASGSGKSTFIRCLNQLEPIDEGTISFRGELLGAEQRDGKLRRRRDSEILRQRRYFGMVFQSFNLFPHMTALQNVASGQRYVERVSAARAERRAAEMLAKVGLANREKSYPNQLSGGQQQRVAIARALAMDPDVLLFDEPTSALDPELVGEVLEVIRDLAKAGSTMVIVTHEMRFARGVADRMIYMDGGRVIEMGTPTELLDNPQSERARQFFLGNA